MQSCNWRVEPFKNCLMRIFIKNINLIIYYDKVKLEYNKLI